MMGKTDHVSGADQISGGSNAPGPDGTEHQHQNIFSKLGDKFKESSLHDVKVKAIHLKHKIGKFQNLVNKNHRHDEEHEQATDRKRGAIADGHRFKSFAPERDGNKIKWYIDGRDYFHAVSVALEKAKETIYIEDWWLSPELYLRRPPYFNQKWRLDQVLKRAAERGVKIYVVLYREVEAAITCNSAHSKHVLEGLCPKDTPGHGNIRVMRHPDHNVLENASDMTFYWAHHEKFIVIDYDMAFIGGLDLCFGRWDTRHHPLACVHPGGVEYEVWPGQDFNNNRIADFKGVDDWKQNEVSKSDYGRMPWHDVAMGLLGPCVYDIAEHFILRWNFVKRDKYKRDDEYDWLTLTGRTGDDEDLIGVQRPKHPVGDYIHHPLSPLEGKLGNPNQRVHLNHGGDDQDATGGETWHDAVEDVDEHGYRKNQHRFGHGLSKNLSQHNIHLPHRHNRPESADPDDLGEYPRHTGNDPKKEGTFTASGGMEEKLKGYSSDIPGKHVVSAQGTVHAQLVRSSADWSSGILTEQSIQTAYCQVIREAKHFVYIENQFFITATGTNQAPIHNQIGSAIVDACVAAGKEGRKFRVIIIIPCIPGFAGDLRDDAAIGTRAIMDYQYKSICRGPDSIFGKIKAAGIDPEQHIFCFNLRSYDRINRTPALKKLEEESGVTYADAQRAQAEDVMDTGLHSTSTNDHKDNVKISKSAQKERDEAQRKGEEFNKKMREAGMQGENNGHPEDSTGVGKDAQTGSRDTISQDAMLGEPKVSEEPWAGRGDHDDEESREQEVQNFIQEELYIHGKLLIVDDRVVICGSSNINDRSQLGYHDSELSIVMEDTLPLESKMDGQAFTAGVHAAGLRRMLWREHLGLLPAQPLDANEDINAQPPGDGDNDYCKGDEYDELVEDPLNDKLWDMWTERATVNTKVFRHLFHADPDDNVKTFEQYDNFLGAKGSRKAGHLYDLYTPAAVVRAELDKIKGHLVWMPLHFLCDAKMAEGGLQVNSFTESVYT